MVTGASEKQAVEHLGDVGINGFLNRLPQGLQRHFIAKYDALSMEQKCVVMRFVHAYKMFLTGSAGTGKTYLVSFLIELAKALYPKEGAVVVTASTGLAASALNGITLHKFVGFPMRSDMTVDKAVEIIENNVKTLARWRKVRVLFVDEVSMIPEDFLTFVNEVAKRVRCSDKQRQAMLRGEYTPKPMGGIQIVFSGDFFQLPPVGSNARLCFESPAWREVTQHTLILKHVHRQSESAFVRLLNEVRRGRLSQAHYQLLLTRVLKSPEQLHALQTRPTFLFSTNEAADRMNAYHMQRLDTQQQYFFSDAEGAARNVEALKASVRLPDKLVLKVGAEVLLIKNLDVECGIVNGAAGVVLDFRGDPDERNSNTLYPFVRFTVQRMGHTEEIERLVTREEWVMESGGVQLAKLKHLPLRPAYAITIHKSQGMTLSNGVVIDVTRGMFAEGQLYVAISRAPALHLVHFIGKPKKKDVMASAKVVRFYEKCEAAEELKSLVEAMKHTSHAMQETGEKRQRIQVGE